MQMSKAQGSTEYLFVIATVMVMVLLAIRVLSHPTTDHILSTGKSIKFTSTQAKVELIAQKYNNTQWWQDYGQDYTNCMNGDVQACEKILSAYPED